jgi:DNA-binding MarR family transcriptional regulator
MNELRSEPDVGTVAALAAELRAVVGKVKRRLRTMANTGDLTVSQLSALSRLEREGPATVTTLARAEGMRPQSMGAIVSALEAAGLVSGAPDPGDGRQTILSLTAACRAWVESARAARQDWLIRAIETHLTPDEQVELTRAMRLLDRIVESA